MGDPWAKLMEAYNILKGNLWVLVLLSRNRSGSVPGHEASRVHLAYWMIRRRYPQFLWKSSS
jgi:hypothetical protein